MKSNRAVVQTGEYDAAIVQVERCLSDAGLQVVRSFDYQSAHTAFEGSDCGCPYHGTSDCDCQLVVLLVYGAGSQPVTLLMHGRDRKAFFSLVSVPTAIVDHKLEGLIVQTLSLAHIPRVSPDV